MITPRSNRTFFDALDLAGLPRPTHSPSCVDFVAYETEKAELFLRLLVDGIDFRLVGDPYWYRTILTTALDVQHGSEPDEQDQEPEGDVV